MKVGKKIKQIRKMAGMSQEELADKMNVSRQTVSKWETDVSVPDLENAVLFCRLFDVSLDDFAEGELPVEKEETKITLNDIVKLNKRSRQMTLILAGGLLFLMLGIMSVFVIDAVYNTTAGIEYMLYRYITVGEYANLPLAEGKMLWPPAALIAIGVILCLVYIFKEWKEKKNAK